MPFMQVHDREALPMNRTLTMLAANDIRARILSGEIRAGERIQPAAIAKRLGISPVPVREALQALQGEGFVTIVGHRGAIAAPTSAKELDEFYQLREMLEPAAVRAVDLTLVQERRLGLTNAMERVDDALQRGDRKDFRVAHREFHFGIYACADNDWLLRILAGLYDNCERYRTAATWRRDPREAAEEHRRMLDALLDSRAGVAAELTLAHLEVTKRFALSSLFETPSARERAPLIQGERS